MKIRDFEHLFDLDGFWRYKRLEKKKRFTDKSMLTRGAIMKNWIVPLWGNADPRKLTVRMIDQSMRGIVSDLTRRELAGATKNRILSVLSAPLWK